MAYDRELIYKQAIEAIKKHNLYFIEDIVAFIPASKNYFYDNFPIDSNEYDALKELLEANRINKKIELRRKLEEDRGGSLIALYKLIGTKEERKKLSQNYLDLSGKVETKNEVKLDYGDFNE